MNDKDDEIRQLNSHWELQIERCQIQYDKILNVKEEEILKLHREGREMVERI